MCFKLMVNKDSKIVVTVGPIIFIYLLFAQNV